MKNIFADSDKFDTVLTTTLAHVVEVSERGVKLKLYGEKEARETYYNSLIVPQQGDVVYIQNVSGTILIIGKLQY